MSYITGTLEDFTSRLHQGATGVADLNSFIAEGDVYIQSGTGVVVSQLRNKWDREAQLHGYSFSNSGGYLTAPLFDTASGFWDATPLAPSDSALISGPNSNTINIYCQTEGSAESYYGILGKRRYTNLNQTISATGSWMLTNFGTLDSLQGISLAIGILSGNLSVFAQLGTGIFSLTAANSGYFTVSLLNNQFSGLTCFRTSISGSLTTGQVTITLSGLSIT